MRRRATLGSTVLALATSGGLGFSASAVTAPTVRVTATGSSGTTVSGSGQLAVTGDTTAAITVAHLSGGNAVLAPGPGAGLPSAVQFPPYVASGTYPRAVVRVGPSSGAGLDPGSADFEYGAVLRLDPTSSGRSVDNGDNVFQRGLSYEASMFKLQADSGRPSCRVRGSSGEVFVRSTTTLTRGSWYTARCSRTASQLSIEVSRYGSTTVVRTVATGPTGALSFPAGRPAAIGGKLNASGDIVSSSSDQLNGAVAQVWTERL